MHNHADYFPRPPHVAHCFNDTNFVGNILIQGGISRRFVGKSHVTCVMFMCPFILFLFLFNAIYYKSNGHPYIQYILFLTAIISQNLYICYARQLFYISRKDW